MKELIRKLFSKGGVSISQNSIIVFYGNKTQWFSQYISGNFKDLLSQLLHDCLEFEIYNNGNLIKLKFTGVAEFNEIGFFFPLEQECKFSLEDLHEIAEEYGAREPLELDIDFNKCGLDDVIEALRPYIRKDTIKFSDKTWQEMKRLASVFQREIGFRCAVEIYPPDDIGDGHIEMDFQNCKILGKSKEILNNLIDTAKSVEIEGCAAESVIRFIIYAYD